MFFCLQDCPSPIQVARVEYQARHNIPELFTTNLLLIHVITLNVDWI